jgi:hypothetical protein
MSICKQTYYNNGSYLRARSNEKAICDLITAIENGTVIPSIVNGGTFLDSIIINGDLTVNGTVNYQTMSFDSITVPTIYTDTITFCNNYVITCSENGIDVYTNINAPYITVDTGIINAFTSTTISSTDITSTNITCANMNDISNLTVDTANINNLNVTNSVNTLGITTLDSSNATITDLSSTTITSNTIYTSTILPVGTDIDIGYTGGNININAPITIEYNDSLTNINQLGYNYYSLTQRIASISISGTTSFVFSPQSGDSTPPVLLPAGVYRIDMNISIVSLALNVTTITWNAGYCYSTALPMTSGNTTRITLIGSGGVSDTSHTSGDTKLEYFSCVGVFTVTSSDANTRYYAGFASLGLGNITVGTADCKIISSFITRIA